jgi:PDZ domain
VEAKLVEQPVLHIEKDAHKNHGRHLHGIRLWLARSVYFLFFALILVFFGVGFPAYLNGWRQGGIGAAAYPSSDGKVILYVIPNGDAASAGIQNGDVLTAINGTPVPSATQANQLLTGQAGDPVNITVQSGAALPRQVSLTFAGGFLQLLSRMHLSLQFLVIYNVTFTSLLALAVFLASPLVFLRHSKDWLVILIAFSMITFASFFITPVKYGTIKLHVGFINNLIYMIGMVAMVIVFFLFPSGRFEPRWTRWVAIFLFIPAVLDFLNLEFANSVLFDFCLWIPFYILGTIAQVYRYRHIATSVERPQTKQVVFGVVLCVCMLVILNLTIFSFGAYFSYAQYILFSLVVEAGAILPVVALDWSFVFAIYHYRLWDTDLYINRTLVYGMVTLFLMLVWVLTTQVLNFASQQFLGKQINWLGALVSSLPVAVIYKPVQKWVEKWVNTRFYKDRIDYSEALIELRPEMWNFLTPTDLGHTLVTIIPALLQSSSGALFIQEKKLLKLTEVHNMHPSDAYKFSFTEEILKKLENATIVNLPENAPFAMLVPLTVSRFKVNDLVGVLAVGPRTQGRGYSRDHLNDLSALGRNAGMALHMLKLNEKKHANEIPASVEG